MSEPLVIPFKDLPVLRPRAKGGMGVYLFGVFRMVLERLVTPPR